MEDGKIIKPLLLMDGFELHRQAAPLVRRDNNKQIHTYIYICVHTYTTWLREIVQRVVVPGKIHIFGISGH